MPSHSQNTPELKLSANYVELQNSYGDLAFQGEYSGANLIYSGLARPGVDTSIEKWQIRKLTYSGDNLVSITWPQDPNGRPSSEFIFEWDDRASYTYA
jgi:hypothetical protein